MAQEYAIGSRVVQMHDFLEGVRALIVDKDNSPKWDPPTAEAVTDAWIDAIFSSLPDNEEWTPLTWPCHPPFVTPDVIRGPAFSTSQSGMPDRVRDDENTEIPNDLRNPPRRTARRRHAGDAQPPAGLERAQLVGSRRPHRRFRCV